MSSTTKVHPTRLQTLSDRDVRPDRDYVLYWMQHSQRSRHNDALEYAAQRANEHDLPLVVGFGLTEDYPDGSLRHFRFMLQGLRSTAAEIRDRNMAFVLRLGSPPQVAIELAERAAEVIVDRGYLRHHRDWRQKVAEHIDVRLTQVECDLIVPVEVASDKREYAARTIRKQINDAADDYLVELKTTAVNKHAGDAGDLPTGEDTDAIDALLDRMTIDRSVKPVDWIRGGTKPAIERLRTFCDDHLTGYDDNRSDVQDRQVSVMSPYLHLGMISPVEVYRTVRDARSRRTDDIDSYLEELLVRRELTHNFVHYCPDDYDSLDSLPDWAAETLAQHRDDKREKTYTAEQLENAETDDPIWNAAMTQMRECGYLHNHLRMFWGKQFIHYTNTPQYAHQVLLHLNNKYFLDGRDANSYANVLWCFGLHDRAWTERDVIGKTRAMTAGGLKRKFDTDAYVRSVLGDSSHQND